MTYTCPICGYTSLPAPPADYLICPCCGTEFGNDDQIHTAAALRARWIHGGMSWFSKATPPPEGWNAIEQAATIMSYADIAHIHIQLMRDRIFCLWQLMLLHTIWFSVFTALILLFSVSERAGAAPRFLLFLFYVECFAFWRIVAIGRRAKAIAAAAKGRD